MGRGNRDSDFRNLFARATAALLARSRNQSRADVDLALVGDRIFAREFVFPTGMAGELRQRFRHFASEHVDSATVDHRNVFCQFAGRRGLALRRVQ